MADTLVHKALSTLGLSADEITIYLALIGKNIMPVMRLSKITGFPRTTLYRICEGLAAKKFIEFVVTRQGKKVKAVEPNNLTGVIEDYKTHLREIEDAQKVLVKNLSLDINQIPATTVKYYSGKEGGKQLIWNTLKASSNIYGYTTMDRESVYGQEFTDEYNLEAAKRKLIDHTIMNPVMIEKLTYLKQNQSIPGICTIKILDLDIVGDTYIYNDIYAVNFWDQDEIVGVEIKNAQLMQLQMAIFQRLWDQATPIEKYQ